MATGCYMAVKGMLYGADVCRAAGFLAFAGSTVQCECAVANTELGMVGVGGSTAFVLEGQ